MLFSGTQEQGTTSAASPRPEKDQKIARHGGGRAFPEHPILKRVLKWAENTVGSLRREADLLDVLRSVKIGF